MKYGNVVKDIANRRKLGRNLASFFILLQFLRRFLQAFIILWFYNYPVIQVIFSLILNQSYASFILAYQVYQSKRVLFFEVANEVVIILTIYFLMMYAGFFITDAKTRNQLGKPMIYLTIANFSVNLLPFLYDIGRTLWLKLRRFYIRRKH